MMGPEPNTPSDMLQGPAARSAAMPNYLSTVTDYLASRGRFGDRILAHLSLPEANLLARLGGAATRNPQTGLLEFYGISGGDTRADPGAPGGGNSAGAVGGGGNAGGGIRGGDVRADPGSFGGGTSDPAYGGSGAVGADYTGGSGYASHAAYHDQVVNALAKMADYENLGNTPLENFGNFLARALGFNEISPYAGIQQAFAAGKPVANQADWGFDPAGLIGGAIGTALGVPGLGLAADMLSQWAGRPLEANLGPNVFGSGSQMASAAQTPGSMGGAGQSYTGAPMSGGYAVRGGYAGSPVAANYLAAMPMSGTQQVAQPSWSPPWMGNLPNGGAMNMLAQLRQSYA